MLCEMFTYPSPQKKGGLSAANAYGFLLTWTEEQDLFPLQSCFQKLKLLFMNNKVEQEMEINIGNLIGGSTQLNVLFIEYSLLKSLPLIISLTTLVLHDRESLESIVVVGQLESLEILICHSYGSIKELPEQVRALKRLKLLEISHCHSLKRVAAGVISSLVALEELKITHSFKNWTIENGNEEASLREIESLKKLRCLDIQVSDIALAAQVLRISPELLVQFTVHFGEFSFHFEFPTKRYQRRVSLNFGDNDTIKWGDLSENIFLSLTESLFAIGDEVFKLNIATAQSMKRLTLELFRNKKNITKAAAAFPLLDLFSHI